ncbi:MAG: ABC transporter permease [Flavobacteriales bacterium]
MRALLMARTPSSFSDPVFSLGWVSSMGSGDAEGSEFRSPCNFSNIPDKWQPKGRVFHPSNLFPSIRMGRGWGIILESARMGLQALRGDRLRTFLSLLGITIGIFAITAVFTLVDTLEKNVRQSVKALGEDVVFLQKWPWPGEGGEYEWWEYLKRPQPKMEEFEKLKDRLPSNTSMAFMADNSASVHHANSTVNRVTVRSITHGFGNVRDIELAKGRYLSPLECRSGRNVAVLGASIAKNLFPKRSAVGKRVKVKGRAIRVVGVLKKEGSSIAQFSLDNNLLLPHRFGGKIFADEERERTILIRAGAGIDQEALKVAVRGALRSIRRLPPKRSDNFALNSPTLISENLNEFFSRMDIAGTIIGFFSILVGGFSIANIMFVSVKERTPQIGIQKALGAKKTTILSQFLFESTFLCLLGGGIGLLLVFLLSVPIGALLGNPIFLSLENILLGVGISLVIGVLSGLFPAFVASRLDPVEAIRA